MAIKNTARLRAVHEESLRLFAEAESVARPERLQCLNDRRFVSITGAMWEGDLASQFENKPKFEVNKIMLAIIRIINEYRNNRITVDFVSKEGNEYDKLAETCNDLFRADEIDSCAEEAYDNAFEEAVSGGFGAYRLCTEYEDEEDEENDKQRVRTFPIFDADSCVFFDLAAKRQDKSDAKHCWVLTSMTPSDYIETYGDDPATWPKSINAQQFDWYSPNTVYVAEHYKVEKRTETVRIWETIDGEKERYTQEDFDEDETLEEKLLAIGSKEIKVKKVKTQCVHKYIESGGGVLEDCGIIAGKHIPIVPVYGKRWFIDNIERCMGHVRLAKDAQRLKNMQLSKLGELSALSSVEKPILAPEQIMGHQQMWADDNIKNYPYLLINPVTDMMGNTTLAPPIAYTRSPQIPPAMAALLQVTEQDMADILGNQQGGDEIVSNISGKAVEMIQTRLDGQTFIYFSNMAKAKKRGGEIWLSMIRDIAVEEGRKMKGVNKNGDTVTIELMRPMVNEKGQTEIENDLSEADFDVAATIGASSASKRQATVRSLMGMMQITQDPETLQVLGAMAMMNMEGEGIADVRDYFRNKMIKQGVVKPSQEEAQALAQEQANTPPDANQEYLKAAAEQAQAEATKARADTVYTVARAKETEAKTIKTLSEVDDLEQKQALDLIDKMPQLGNNIPSQPVAMPQQVDTMQNPPSAPIGELE